MRFAIYKLGNFSDAQDAVSDTFLEALKGISNLKNANSFTNWIFKILIIKCKQQIKKHLTNKENIKKFLEPLIQEQLHTSTELWDALSRLNRTERELILLNSIYGYTAVELSKICRMPQGTVSSKIYRGIKKLKKMLV